jgi:hypothetical protein
MQFSFRQVQLALANKMWLGEEKKVACFHPEKQEKLWD